MAGGDGGTRTRLGGENDTTARALPDGCGGRARGRGLEPLTTGPEPAVLPITPPPIGARFKATRSPGPEPTCCSRYGCYCSEMGVSRSPGS